MEKKISLIVAAYNVEKYIEKCVESIIKQTYENLEIILVNDGSNDSTLRICKKFRASDQRVIIIDRENGGLSAARNSGLDIATGDYICFVDGDDYIKNTYCEELLKVAETHDSDIVMFSYFRDYGDRIVPLYNDGKTYTMNRDMAIKELIINDRIKSMACMKFYKSNLFEKLRFREGVGYEDVYLMHHLFLMADKFCVYNFPLYYYLFRLDSISNVQSEINLFNRYESLIIRFNELSDIYPELKKLLIEKVSYTFVDIYNSMKAGKYNDNNNVLLRLVEFFRSYKKDIPLKIKIMFTIVRMAGFLNLSRVLHVLMVKIINS